MTRLAGSPPPSSSQHRDRTRTLVTKFSISKTSRTGPLDTTFSISNWKFESIWKRDKNWNRSFRFERICVPSPFFFLPNQMDNLHPNPVRGCVLTDNNTHFNPSDSGFPSHGKQPWRDHPPIRHYFPTTSTTLWRVPTQCVEGYPLTVTSPGTIPTIYPGQLSTPWCEEVPPKVSSQDPWIQRFYFRFSLVVCWIRSLRIQKTWGWRIWVVVHHSDYLI